MADQILVPQTKKDIVCDGGGVMGHPKIYLAFGANQKILCPYCSREFIKESTDGQ